MRTDLDLWFPMWILQLIDYHNLSYFMLDFVLFLSFVCLWFSLVLLSIQIFKVIVLFLADFCCFNQSVIPCFWLVPVVAHFVFQSSSVSLIINNSPSIPYTRKFQAVQQFCNFLPRLQQYLYHRQAVVYYFTKAFDLKLVGEQQTEN